MSMSRSALAAAFSKTTRNDKIAVGSSTEPKPMSKLTLAIGAIAVIPVSVPASAGPCLNDITQAVEDTQRVLDAVAAKGKAGTESTFATTHRQPTQMTVAGAEEQLGEVSEAKTRGGGAG
jgi:hypothetical protein